MSRSNAGPSETWVVVFVPILHGRTTVTLRHHTSSAPYLIVGHDDQGMLMSGRSEYDTKGGRTLLSNRLASTYSRDPGDAATGPLMTGSDLRIRPHSTTFSLTRQTAGRCVFAS
jgi:hypothetical protein